MRFPNLKHDADVLDVAVALIAVGICMLVGCIIALLLALLPTG